MKTKTVDIRITASAKFWNNFDNWKKRIEIRNRNHAFLRAAQIAMEKHYESAIGDIIDESSK
jgi:hypothetical protein